MNNVSVYNGKGTEIMPTLVYENEKGVDITRCAEVSKRAVQLLCDLCGGEAVRGCRPAPSAWRLR